MSPVTAIAFTAVAITGVMMLCGVHRYVKPLHEWMGLAMAIAGCIHLVLNWRALLSYFDRRSAQVAAGLTVLLCLLLLIAGSHGGPGDGHHGPPRPAQTDAD